MYEQSAMRSHSSADNSKEGDDSRVTPGSEDYYPRVAVAALIKVSVKCFVVYVIFRCCLLRAEVSSSSTQLLAFERMCAWLCLHHHLFSLFLSHQHNPLHTTPLLTGVEGPHVVCAPQHGHPDHHPDLQGPGGAVRAVPGADCPLLPAGMCVRMLLYVCVCMYGIYVCTYCMYACMYVCMYVYIAYFVVCIIVIVLNKLVQSVLLYVVLLAYPMLLVEAFTLSIL